RFRGLPEGRQGVASKRHVRPFRYDRRSPEADALPTKFLVGIRDGYNPGMRSPVRPNTAGALVPPFDPFARGAGERYLPTGTRITLLISRQSYGSPRGSRVVVGSVRGYAPRSRTSVDLELDRISTWLQEDPADEVETLPAEFSALFRVSLV